MAGGRKPQYEIRTHVYPDTYKGVPEHSVKRSIAEHERAMDEEARSPHPDPVEHDRRMYEHSDHIALARAELSDSAKRFQSQRTLPGTGPGFNKAHIARAENIGRVHGGAEGRAETDSPYLKSVREGTERWRQSHVADIARANQNLEHIRKKNLPIDEHVAESAKWLKLKQGAEQQLAKIPAAEQRGTQEGARGGRFYVSATGQKVYVKSNPGAEVVGHMTNQRFHMGLPMSCHLAEPRKSR